MKPGRAAIPALLLICALLSARPVHGAESALDRLRERAPRVAERLDPAARAMLARVPAEQLETLQEGETRASGVRLGDGRTLTEFATALFGGAGLAIPFWSTDGGGGLSGAGSLVLLGTVGQPDAALAENASAGLLLVGGFRGRGALAPGVLFRDDFETGGTGRWDARLPPSP